MAECPSEELMARYAAGACDADASAMIRCHLVKCPKCADWLAEAQASEAILPDVRAAMDAHEAAKPGRLEQGRGEGRVKLPSGIIKGYELREELGHGGMGVVYLARQALPERDVAIKVMDTGTASRSGLRRFRYESQVLARILHPNIAQVYEVGTVDLASAEGVFGTGDHGSLPYFVMEYVPGAESITKHADKHRLDIRARLELFLQVCEAVQHGHQKGVIHRDLKPSNILVDVEGRVRVIDFGVARSTDSDVAATTVQTDVGQIVGTLQYMSPEQCEADPLNLDIRTDVYSLGVVLYELLTERLPYDVSNMTLHSAIRRICEQAPTRPSTLVRHLSGDLEMLILKALEKQREKRYQSAADLATDLRRYLAGEPISVHPPTPWTRAVRWAWRHPLGMTAGACAALIVTSLVTRQATVWWWDEQPARLERAPDNYGVNLLARSGSVLQSWPADDPRAISFAKLLKRPRELGGGLAVILGFGLAAEERYRGSLCAFATAGGSGEPTWKSRIELPDMPSSMLTLNRGPDQTSAQVCLVADIFDDADTPGDEIVACFGLGEFSQVALRVVDQRGNVLFQVWQDGCMNPFRWLSRAKLLVIAGADEDLKFTKPQFRWQAPTVFAIQPKRNLNCRNEFMSMVPGEGAFGPVWCKVIEIPERYGLTVDVDQLTPACEYDRERLTTLSLRFKDLDSRAQIDGTVSLIIGENGEEQRPRIASDSYRHDQRSAQPRLPRLEEIKLVDRRDLADLAPNK